MGKGTIISGGPTGSYLAESVYRQDLKDAQVEALDGQISHYQSVIPGAEGREKNILIAGLLSCTKRKQYLEDNFPDDFQQTVWCADFTEDLAGDVGLIEIPGEKTNLNIVPGFDGEAAWNPERDGQLTPTVSMSPAQAWFNLAVLPGWQKWKPTFRYATIDSIDGDTADVTLVPASSSQQGLDVNQGTTIADVPISYMDCDGEAFSGGDIVIIKFTGQDYDNPSIIGFKDNPQPCGGNLIVYLTMTTGTGPKPQFCFVWDLDTNGYVEVPDNLGDPVSGPILVSEISDWIDDKTPFGGAALQSNIVTPINTPALDAGDTVHDFTQPCPIIATITYDISNPVTGFDENGDFNHDTTLAGSIIFYGGSVVDGSQDSDIITISPIRTKLDGLLNYELTSLGATDKRGRAVSGSSDHSFQRAYEHYGATACSQGFTGTFHIWDINTFVNTYTFKSPFADDAVFVVDLPRADEFYGEIDCVDGFATSDRDGINSMTYVAGGEFGNAGYPHMVSFYVEEIIVKHIESDSCGYVHDFEDFRLEYRRLALTPQEILDSFLCDIDCDVSDTVTGYTTAKSFSIKAFSSVTAGNPDTLNPFEAASNPELQTAMVALKDLAELESGIPTTGQTAGVSIDLSFVK